MTAYEQAYRDLRAGVEALVSDWQANGNSRALGDPTADTWHKAAEQLLALLTSSAPATASEHIVHVTVEPIAEDAVWCDECEEWVSSVAPESDPATASEGATEPGICLWANQICEQPNHHGCLTCTTTADRDAAGVTSSDGDRGLSDPPNVLLTEEEQEAVDRAALVFGWQHLARYSGQSDEWLERTLAAMVRTALATPTTNERSE